MSEPTPIQSLDILHRIIEKVPMTGEERDGARFHAQNISKALQPKEMSAPGPAVTPENGRSAE